MASNRKKKGARKVTMMLHLASIIAFLIPCEFVNGFQQTLMKPHLPTKQSYSKVRRGLSLKEEQEQDQYDDSYWKSVLSPEEYFVMRQEGTEAPWSSELNNIKSDESELGFFRCTACGSPLFLLNSKFESGSGWPSFTHPFDVDSIKYKTDFTLLVPRTECRCNNCDSHLGHVFNDGPAQSTGLRYCVNGVALKYMEGADASKKGKEPVSNISDISEKRLIDAVADVPSVSIKNLPLSLILPDIALNSAAAGLFLTSFVRSQPLVQNGNNSIMILFPLVFGMFYLFRAVTPLVRFFR